MLGYRFGSGVIDCLICATCGVYLGARIEADGAVYATLNLNAFEEAQPDLVARPVSYEGESAAARMERRRLNWTPVRGGGYRRPSFEANLCRSASWVSPTNSRRQ